MNSEQPLQTKGTSKDIITGIAITLLIFTLSVYMPIIGFFCSLLLPLPVLFYRSKLGRRVGLIVPGGGLVIMVIALGGLTIDIVFFFELLLLGFLLSELFEMELSVEKTVLLACGGVILSGVLGLLFFSSISGRGVSGLISDYIAKNLEVTLALYEGMGMSEENLHLFSNSLDKIQYVLVRIVPAMVVASTLFVTWTNLLIARPVFKKSGLSYPAFGTLKLWKAPDYLIWGLIGCGVLLLFPSRFLKLFGLNGLLILLTVYFFQGIAIVSYFFEKKRFPRLLRLLLYSLIAVQQILLLFVIGLGIFDMWLNFRKIGSSAE